MKFEHFRIFRGVPPTKMWKKKEIVKIRERRCIFYEITEKCGDARGSVRFHDFLHIFVAQTKNPAISWNHQDPRASAHFRAEKLSNFVDFAFQKRLKIDFEELYSILKSNKTWKMSCYSGKTAHLCRKISCYSGKTSRYSEKKPCYSRVTLVKLSCYNFCY